MRHRKGASLFDPFGRWYPTDMKKPMSRQREQECETERERLHTALVQYSVIH